MKLRMRTLYATAERTVSPGQVADFPKKEAEVLIKGGYAVKADDDPAEREKNEDAEPGTTLTEPPRSGSGSGKKAWVEHVTALKESGVDIDVTDDDTRDTLVAKVDAVKADADGGE